MTRGTRLIGYLRCSTDKQEDSGLGLAAQRAAIERECDRQGWELADVRQAVVSGGVKDPAVLRSVREAIEAGEAAGLIVSHLDRLFRSAKGFEDLIDWAERGKYAVVILDPRIDTTDPMGLVMARVGMAFAEYERKRISKRIKDALAAKKANGGQLGRPLEVSAEDRDYVIRRWREGAGMKQIARELNAAGRLRVAGGQWGHQQVGRLLRSAGEVELNEFGRSVPVVVA